MAGEARVLPGPPPRKSQAKTEGPCIMSNPRLAKLTLISLSDFGSKKSLNLWGKSKLMPSFLPRMAGRWLSMKHIGLAGDLR